MRRGPLLLTGGLLALAGCSADEPDYAELALAAGYEPRPAALLTEAEFNARQQARTPFGDADSNGDGEIPREEWRQSRTRFHFMMDIDADGRLSWPEYALSACGLPPRSAEDVFGNSCYAFRLAEFYASETSGDRLLDRDEFAPIALNLYRDFVTCQEYGVCGPL